MPKITNHSPQAITIFASAHSSFLVERKNPKTGAPGVRTDIPADALRRYADSPQGKKFIAAGTIEVEFKASSKPETPKRTPRQEVLANRTEETINENHRIFLALHYKQAIAAVEEMDDLDELAELHALDGVKASVTKAIEKRMEALRAD